MNLAAGLPTLRSADELLSHASNCEHCAEELRQAVALMSGVETPAEREFLREIEGRAEVAAHAPPDGGQVRVMPPQRLRPGRVKWLVAATAAFCTAGITWWFAGSARDHGVELARIYSTHREFELRIPGAAYGRFSGTRGSESRHSPEFLELAARIAKDLRDRPGDTRLLAAKGRLELLSLNPVAAIEALKTAQDLGATAPETAIDLATAYYLRGRQNQNNADFTMAVEVLSRVIQTHPGNAEALFNRAVVEAEQQLLLPAIEDLEKAISVETSPEWKREAGERLAQLRAKTRGLLEQSPRQLRERFAEVALQEVMRSEVLHPGPELPSLARRLERDHRDFWLRDVLALPRSPRIIQAMSVLAWMADIRVKNAIALYAETAGDFDRLTHLPPPLEAWRRLEALYRATRLRETYACPPSHRFFAGSRYPWIDIQSAREQASCAYLNQQVQVARSGMSAAAQLARSHGYDVARSRITTLLANFESRHGNFRDALNMARREVDEIIRSGFPVQRSHEYFVILMLTAARLERLHAARRAAVMGARVAQIAGFDGLYFTNLSYWGELALRCGEAAEAEAVYAEAIGAYLRSGGKIASAGWHAWAQMNLADVTSRPDLLAPYEAVLENSRDPRLWLPYQRVKARFEAAAGKIDSAVVRLERVVDFAAPSGRGDSPVWRDEQHWALTRLIALLVRQNRIREAYHALQNGRGAGSPPVLGDPSFGEFALAPLDQRIGVWRRVGQDITFRWAGLDVFEYDRLARRLLRLASSRQSAEEDILSTARRIGEALFGEWLTQYATDQPVVFQNDIHLPEIPFGLLPGRNGALALDKPVLVSRAPLGRLASARLHRILAVDSTQAGYSAAWALAPLPAADSELAAVERFGGRTVVLRGPDATVSSLQARMPGADLMHFAGHAVPQADGVALLLNPDRMHSTGLLDLSNPAQRVPQVVVLSACSTARNAQNEVDTVRPMSLARQFLARGSREVIASHWDVDAQASSHFMSLFYSTLAISGDLGRALLDAQRRMRADPRFTHPYFWGVYARLIQT
jgi:tetratricopeptide (TPR) repeat protein